MIKDKPKDFYNKIQDNKYHDELVRFRVRLKTGLAINNWKKEDYNVLQNFERFTAQIPSGHIKNNDKLRFFENHSKDTHNAYAHYRPSDNAISLSDKSVRASQRKGNFTKGNEFSTIFVHEIGHAVQNKLTEKDSESYKDFAEMLGWKRGDTEKHATGEMADIKRKQDSDELITKYAQKSPSEAFAEYYSYYFNNKSSINKMLDGGSIVGIKIRGKYSSLDKVEKSLPVFKWMKDNVFENKEIAKAFDLDYIEK